MRLPERCATSCSITCPISVALQYMSIRPGRAGITITGSASTRTMAFLFMSMISNDGMRALPLLELAATHGPVGRRQMGGTFCRSGRRTKAYRDTLTGCYAFHQASGKPYLRPRVPEAPDGRMFEFSPGGIVG